MRIYVTVSTEDALSFVEAKYGGRLLVKYSKLVLEFRYTLYAAITEFTGCEDSELKHVLIGSARDEQSSRRVVKDVVHTVKFL